MTGYGSAPHERQGVRSHRRTTPAGRLGYRLLAALLILGALVAGGAITAYTPNVDQREEPYLQAGAAGTPVVVRTFDATVLGVRGAEKIVASDQTHDTGGIWVLVRVQLVARTDPVTVGYAALRDRHGRLYRASARVTQPLAEGGRRLQPRIPVAGEIVFEVPVAEATALRLRLAARPIDQRMDAMADIALPIDAGLLSQWQAAPPLTLAPAEIAP